MKISVIIRTYNESANIEQVLRSLNKQTYRNFETIIVDSESTDTTLQICSQYNTNIIGIKKSEFNYSYASNVGAEHATGDVLCYISGHSVPLKPDYLERAARHFEDQSIGGVYGEAIALSSGSLTEKAFYGLGYIKSKLKGIELETEIHPGILSCSNAFVRTDLWKKFKFTEALGHGGEDVEMAYRILKDGYQILRDPDIVVKHSHGKGFKAFKAEFANWRTMYADVLHYIESNK